MVTKHLIWYIFSNHQKLHLKNNHIYILLHISHNDTHYLQKYFQSFMSLWFIFRPALPPLVVCPYVESDDNKVCGSTKNQIFIWFYIRRSDDTNYTICNLVLRICIWQFNRMVQDSLKLKARWFYTNVISYLFTSFILLMKSYFCIIGAWISLLSFNI